MSIWGPGWSTNDSVSVVALVGSGFGREDSGESNGRHGHFPQTDTRLVPLFPSKSLEDVEEGGTFGDRQPETEGD